MNIYIASRFDRRSDVIALQQRLRNLGHTIIVDWTVHDSIKPYEHHADLSAAYAQEDAHGAMDCDVFILLSDESGTGMYTEFGAALASSILRGTPRIFIVGEHINRSFFYFHPGVRRCESIEDVMREL